MSTYVPSIPLCQNKFSFEQSNSGSFRLLLGQDTINRYTTTTTTTILQPTTCVSVCLSCIKCQYQPHPGNGSRNNNLDPTIFFQNQFRILNVLEKVCVQGDEVPIIYSSGSKSDTLDKGERLAGQARIFFLCLKPKCWQQSEYTCVMMAKI